MGMYVPSILDKYCVQLHPQPTKVPFKLYIFTDLISLYVCRTMYPATEFKYIINFHAALITPTLPNRIRPLVPPIVGLPKNSRNFAINP
jgi:hypothetical protein